MVLKIDNLKKNSEDAILTNFFEKINDKSFPCVGAKAAFAHDQIKCFVAGDMSTNIDDENILNFLYSFVDRFREADNKFHSAVILFKEPMIFCEHQFEQYLWDRLQSISDLDAKNYKYDSRVTSDPASANFSFSIKEEAFFIIGLHPRSSRPARRFPTPAIVFNPHIQFEDLRQSGKYEHLQHSIRKRDEKLAGSINPMLKNFGESSEAWQYSGIKYSENWECPLKINHGK